jgi:hypothetical protein
VFLRYVLVNSPRRFGSHHIIDAICIPRSSQDVGGVKNGDNVGLRNDPLAEVSGGDQEPSLG